MPVLAPIPRNAFGLPVRSMAPSLDLIVVSIQHPDRSYPVIQILTAEEILAGEDADIPRLGSDTFKKASKTASESPKNLGLFYEND